MHSQQKHNLHKNALKNSLEHCVKPFFEGNADEYAK